MIDKYLEKLKGKSSERKYIKNEIASWEQKQKDNSDRLEHLESARSIIQTAAQTTQSYLSIQLSDIVSNALKAVFQDNAYEFKIDFVQRRNSTECDLLFSKDGKDMKPLDSCGYGAADIASLALRVAYWKLDGTARNILLMDEPTRNLSLDKQPLAGEIIKQLSESLELQFLIVTHNIALAQAADKIFKVTKNKYSRIKEI